ncbi:hypothetical protein XNW1_2840013 [Xenorhabdus nematophila str. Websteri]|nr:hypothetical protein XNA1_2790004 [Xenorhabdus nematophila str. Anatoliense]CEF30738.1 hypothetical protein XNW1_2840013 [Xenorhabdus nematophila str. Websteri]
MIQSFQPLAEVNLGKFFFLNIRHVFPQRFFNLSATILNYPYAILKSLQCWVCIKIEIWTFMMQYLSMLIGLTSLGSIMFSI